MKNKYTKKLKPLKILYNNEIFLLKFFVVIKNINKIYFIKDTFFVELMFILNPSSILTTKYKKNFLILMKKK